MFSPMVAPVTSCFVREVVSLAVDYLVAVDNVDISRRECLTMPADCNVLIVSMFSPMVAPVSSCFVGEV